MPTTIAKRLLQLTQLICFIFLLGCGQQQQTEHVRDFRIYIDNDDSVMRDTIRDLTKHLNDQLGDTYFDIVASRAEATSEIRFVEGLKEESNKLGVGQWFRTTEKVRVGATAGLIDTRRSQTTVHHSMQLLFDYDHFRAKAKDYRRGQEVAADHLYHLFCHEIGHGVQMEHAESEHDIMYPTIPEEKRDDLDYDGFYRRVLGFMNAG